MNKERKINFSQRFQNPSTTVVKHAFKSVLKHATSKSVQPQKIEQGKAKTRLHLKVKMRSHLKSTSYEDRKGF